MQVLKQSTTATILVGPVLDADGAAYTAAVIGDFNITKNGSTAALAAAATATHSHNGMYLIALTTGNTDTLGRLDVSMNNTSYAMTNHRYEVLTANQFDALVTNGTVTPAAITTSNWAALTVDHTSTGSFGYVIGIFFSLIEFVTGWRFTAKAVEQAGGADVYVYPLAIGQEQRNTHQEITVYTSETGSQYFFAVDSNNTALDLTGLSLEFRVGDNKTKAILYTASTADATLTVTLTNKVTFTKSTKFTRFANSDVSYSLRNMSAGGEVLLDGPIRLKWAP